MTARAWVTLSVVVIGAIAFAAGVGNIVGHRAERTTLAQQARQDTLQHVAEALRTTAALVDAERRVRVAEASKDSVVRAARSLARSRVRLVDDSDVVVIATADSAGVPIDSVGPKIQIPKEVVATIAADDAVITQDSITLRAQAAELQTLYRRDSLHVDRERLLQEQLDSTKPQRCGRRCGFVAGVTTAATAAVVVTHPAILVHAVAWIVRLVH